MITVAYICDRNRECKDHVSCGVECIRTCDPTYAKNPKTVSLVADLISTFDCDSDIKLVEKEK